MWLQQLFKPIDKIIDNITMYRLLLYYLLGLLVAAFGLSLAGDLHYSVVDIALSSVILVAACWIINKILAVIFDAPVNPESSILTGLILALIIPPTFSNFGILFMLAASGLAMASKYVLTINYKHIFNPAAIAVVLTALGPRQSASWWVGTAVLLPFVIVGGILMVRKLRRQYMAITFLVVTTVATTIFAIFGKTSVPSTLHNMLLSSAVFFLGFVMLTEPYTSPATKRAQIWYAAIVGVLLAPQVHIGSVYTTPEIALIIGNVFAYLVSPKAKLFPILRDKYLVARDTVEFVFIPGRKFAYRPGQYMEWTLPHDDVDSRGARRYFTLASSPTENYVRLGVKFYDEGSTYKSAMLDMNQNTPIVASQLAGDFVMPKNRNQKLAFIAGGIGVTPFRSMVKYLMDTNQNRDVTMLYGAKSQEDFAYRDIFDAARQAIGLRILYVVSDRTQKVASQNIVPGIITGDLIKKTMPDYRQRIFYISGTHAMVEDVENDLRELGVPFANIKIDFFPGYA